MARGGLMRKLLGLTIIAASLGGGWVWMGYDVFLKRGIDIKEEQLIYRIEPGATIKTIAYDLQRLGLIEHPRFFIWMARLRGATAVKAGEYALDFDITPERFLDKIVTGKVIQHSLTIVEGWNFRQLLEAVHGHEKIVQTFDTDDEETIASEMGVSETRLEGKFLPDTYLFPSGTTDVAYLKRAYIAMQTRLETEWNSRADNLPYKTPYDALKMASIVEKETGQPTERPEIASVFVNRLRQGMKLQTDPTVIYGMGDLYEGNIRHKDLITDTPYNTYTRKGLPPTPIAMPSAQAIHAALHPAQGNYLYFVAKGDGSHYFSTTNAEHAQAVKKFQMKRRADYRSSPVSTPKTAPAN